ncbi:eukaryotic translation initiation factor 3subunit E [Striga asiatica]|uniref:Eukaryotic translation initiation factor 3 subunit E n=1 Tax=Striga asiatica TaxID=4170 RepID=A0A5A7NZ72_STRAF|nr:eukaryotic translation initiation factor 3subunit E [Striga asiatica]
MTYIRTTPDARLVPQRLEFDRGGLVWLPNGLCVLSSNVHIDGVPKRTQHWHAEQAPKLTETGVLTETTCRTLRRWNDKPSSSSHTQPPSTYNHAPQSLIRGLLEPPQKELMAAKYDLTQRTAPQLDRHLVFPLLEFLQERGLYPEEDILKAKIELLNHTNMVDYAMDIHKSLYRTEDVPQGMHNSKEFDNVINPISFLRMVERRAEVVGRLKALEEGAAPLISFLQNPNAYQELRADKQHNLQMLHDRYQIGPEQIEALYQYAKFQFECGNYSGAADYLYQYRALCTNSDRSLSALWGKLAAEILMQNWDIALEELNRVKDIIDSKNFSSPLNQVQSRIWLMHWSLFIFFNHDNGMTQIIDLFNQDKYLNAIQTNAPHLLRYLATAFIVNKRRRTQFKEFIKVIQQEQYSYEDPITEFLACIYVNYDFDGAQKKMKECEEVIMNDPFLGKRVGEGNFISVPLRDEFLENARLFIFETYCRIHQRIDMAVLAEKLNLNYEEAERWIVNLIRTSKLEAKIDSETGTIIMEPNHTNVYEQLIDHTKALSGRTYKLVSQLLDHAQPQATR